MDTENKRKPVRETDHKPSAKKAKKEVSVISAGNGRNASPPNAEAGTGDVPGPQSPGENRKLFRVIFFYEWCKSCGICAAMCPTDIILLDERTHPLIEAMDECIGCRNCEIHCPDFAITVKKRHPERRKTNGIR